MKDLIINIRSLFMSLIILYGLSAYAEKMDIDTHNVLIDKLEQVVGLSEEGVSKQALIQRLADLHSERARLYAMENEGKGDIKYKNEIEKDRTAALKLYEKSIKTATNIDKPKILFQMAQIHHLLGNPKKAQKLYEEIVKNQKRYDKELVALAYIELADYDYYKQKFTSARKIYNKAISIKESPRKAYIKYRIAWCDFQLGSTRGALQKMVILLSDTSMFKRPDGSTDQSFQEEASRDLVTFYARYGVTSDDIATIARLSPANAKDANLTYLATELDRTGKKKSALLVWATLGTQKRSDDDKLEGQIKIAKIQYDLNKKDQAIKEIALAAKMLKESDCDDKAKCSNYKQLLRTVVTDWGKAEEREPSSQLIFAYKAYLSEFNDLEMNYWAGIAAQKKKLWSESFNFFKKSSELAYEVIHDSSMKSTIVNVDKIFEGSLLGTIEAAEQTKNLELRDQAYAQYIRLNPRGEKSIEVNYQIAQVFLEKNENEKAANKFKEIALSDANGPKSIKDKAADLAIDTLVVLKDDAKIESWATEFSQKIPSRKQEFLIIARKAIINQAAVTINQSKANSELQKQFDKLSKTSLSSASSLEKINFQKHRLLLATKLKSMSEVILAATMLLKEKGLSKDDQRDANQQLVWAHEMNLDFKSARAVLIRMDVPKGNEGEHTLKLAVMTELAGLNPTFYYEKFLKISNDRNKKQDVALTLVKLAKNPSVAFNKYKSHLSGSSKYVIAGLYSYDHKRSKSLKKDLLNNAKHNTFEAQLLLREDEIKTISDKAVKLSRHKLSKSTKWMKSSIAERVNQIAQMEKIAAGAIKQKDFTLQFLSLASVSIENERLAKDMLALPQPKGLNKEMKKQYSTLLAQQVEPYLVNAKAVKKKVNELWDAKEDSGFKDVLELSNQPTQAGSKVALEEVYSVTRTAKKLKYRVKDLAQKQPERRKLAQELANLKTKVKKNPYDSSYLRKIKDIEERLGSGAMVAYIDARLTKLSAGGKN